MSELDSQSKKLNILNADEIESLYARPNFSREEREEYFALSPNEAAVLSRLRSDSSRLSFILQLGYFKAKQRFFSFELDEVKADVEYVQTTYFAGEVLDAQPISSLSRRKQQRVILKLSGYRLCGQAERQALVRKLEELVRIDSQPVYLFREVMQYLRHQHLILPSYTWMQDAIGQILATEQKRLLATAQKYLMPDEQKPFYQLLNKSEGHYLITQLKQKPRGFGNKEILKEIERGHGLYPLYESTQRVLPYLQISNKSLSYYASLVDYYSVFQLSQLRSALPLIYLLCFVQHRYQEFQDNLIKILLYRVNRYLDSAKTAAQVALYEQVVAFNQNLQKAGQVLSFLTDQEKFPDSSSLRQLRHATFGIIRRADLEAVAQQLSQSQPPDESAFQWQAIDRLTRQFKLSLRPLLCTLKLQSSPDSAPLLEAVRFLQLAFQRKQALSQFAADELPMAFVPAYLKKYLYGMNAQGQRELLLNRYEFLVYRQLVQALEAGRIFCVHSLDFRRFEADLLSDRHWQEKAHLLEQTHLPLLQMDIESQLQDFEALLESRLEAINHHIVAGENSAIQIRSRRSERRWSLPQTALETAINHPFFDSLPQLDIHSLLHFIQQRCTFMDSFQHILSRYGSRHLDESALLAAIVAWGTNTGLGRMGKISDISQSELNRVSDNFLRPQTLHAANDRISNYSASLPIFQQYLLDEQVHSSSDGQKFESALETFNARHSPKYFGLKKGVVAYTLIANHIPINARVIGAYEHESHYVFDLLFNNSSQIQPQIHSTDQHGLNQFNFAILHLFGYQFAPRYTDLYSQFQSGLHGFRASQDYPEAWLIKPIRKIRQDFIISEWDNIQRMMVSLALKISSQALLIRKLHAFPRQHKTRRALVEYDKIIHSLYLLDYLDILSLRRNVQRALNRGENYHHLRRAVSYANFGKLRFHSEYEQALWQECSRLIANAILAYNATILSDLLLYHQSQHNSQQVALLRRVPPVAWQHINFYGYYEFNKQPEAIDLSQLVQNLARFDIALLEL